MAALKTIWHRAPLQEVKVQEPPLGADGDSI